MKQEPARKADQTAPRQAPPGLTPFGMRAMRFARDVFGRAGVRVGVWQPLSLAFLDEEDAPVPAPAPRIELSLTFLLEKLKKARREKEKQKPSAAAGERRVLERLFRVELRDSYLRAQKLSVWFPQLRRELRSAVNRTAERYLSFEKTVPGAEYEIDLIRKQTEKVLEPVFTGGVRRMDEELSRRSRRFDAGILCGFQGEVTRSGGKRPAQTVRSACEYRFLAEKSDLAALGLPSAASARGTDVTRSRWASVSRDARSLRTERRAGDPPVFSQAARNHASGRSFGRKWRLSPSPRLLAFPSLPGQWSAASPSGGWTPKRRGTPPALPGQKFRMRSGGGILLPEVLQMAAQTRPVAEISTAREPAPVRGLWDAIPGRERREGFPRLLNRLTPRLPREERARDWEQDPEWMEKRPAAGHAGEKNPPNRRTPDFARQMIAGNQERAVPPGLSRQTGIQYTIESRTAAPEERKTPQVPRQTAQTALELVHWEEPGAAPAVTAKGARTEAPDERKGPRPPRREARETAFGAPSKTDPPQTQERNRSNIQEPRRFAARNLEPVFIDGGWRTGEELSRRLRRFGAGILCVFQGEAARRGGERPGQTVRSACEYRFLKPLFQGDGWKTATPPRPPEWAEPARERAAGARRSLAPAFAAGSAPRSMAEPVYLADRQSGFVRRRVPVSQRRAADAQSEVRTSTGRRGMPDGRGIFPPSQAFRSGNTLEWSLLPPSVFAERGADSENGAGSTGMDGAYGKMRPQRARARFKKAFFQAASRTKRPLWVGGGRDQNPASRVRVGETKHISPPSRNSSLPLPSQMAAAPSSGGWTPQWGQAHPGLPRPRQSGRSILLPDVMRMRRKAAQARSGMGESLTRESAWDPADTPPGRERRFLQTLDRLAARALQGGRAQEKRAASGSAEKRRPPDGRELAGQAVRDTSVDVPLRLFEQTDVRHTAETPEEGETLYAAQKGDPASVQLTYRENREPVSGLPEGETRTEAPAARGLPRTSRETAQTAMPLTHRENQEPVSGLPEGETRTKAPAARGLPRTSRETARTAMPPARREGGETAPGGLADTEPRWALGLRRVDARETEPFPREDSLQKELSASPSPPPIGTAPQARTELEYLHSQVQESAPAPVLPAGTAPQARAELEYPHIQVQESAPAPVLPAGTAPRARAELEYPHTQVQESAPGGETGEAPAKAPAWIPPVRKHAAGARNEGTRETPPPLNARPRPLGVPTDAPAQRALELARPAGLQRTALFLERGEAGISAKLAGAAMGRGGAFARLRPEGQPTPTIRRNIALFQGVQNASPRVPERVFSRPELTFLQLPVPTEREAPPEDRDTAMGLDAGYVKKLPQWARELLQKPSFAGAAESPFRSGTEQKRTPAPAPDAGAARGGQIHWTAPGAARPGQSLPMFQTQFPDAVLRPAAIEWKDRGKNETAGAPRPFSEAELRRTADRVYALIEERLRRELRRSGR